jgi:large subunit ribosomal protein L31
MGSFRRPLFQGSEISPRVFPSLGKHTGQQEVRRIRPIRPGRPALAQEKPCTAPRCSVCSAPLFAPARAGGRFWKGSQMKKEIHPNYGDATISCACGNVIQTRSTVKEMHVNTCSRCHPYYSGQTKLMDTEGRVQRFQKRYAKKA